MKVVQERKRERRGGRERLQDPEIMYGGYQIFYEISKLVLLQIAVYF